MFSSPPKHLRTGGNVDLKTSPRLRRFDPQQASTGRLLAAVLMSVSMHAAGVLRNVTKRTRPFIEVDTKGRKVQALYDTGADVSCMSEAEFKNIPPHLRPVKEDPALGQQFRGANGGELEVRGIYKKIRKHIHS